LTGWRGRTREEAAAIIARAEIDPNARAEELSLHDFARLLRAIG
jgi:16S rRNA A1518/A1519 N6-dimethyltransferase RsmA/KsgA/DIM1 with predicted DNA glycosylase/AP lyase activity